MMYIDDPVLVSGDEAICQDLHISGKHDKVNLVFREQVQYIGFGLFLLAGRYRYVMKGNTKFPCDWFEFRMIADDQGEVRIDLAVLMAQQQVVEAMIVS